MIGCFLQHETQRHVAPRGRCLAGNGPRRTTPKPLDGAAARLEEVGESIRVQLDGVGVALVQLDRSLVDQELLVLGALLGDPQPERSPDLAPMVAHEVILNLRTIWGPTDDPTRQPFASNPLTLHTESSGAPPGHRPRLIILACVDPGRHTGGAETLVVPMVDVAAHLGVRAKAILSSTAYDAPKLLPPVLRLDDPPLFAFRDFRGAPLRWTHWGDARDDREVDRAIEALLEAMYLTPAIAVQWRPGLLVVIDNERCFHGKTAGDPPDGAPFRHLKRLRLAERVRV